MFVDSVSSDVYNSCLSFLLYSLRSGFVASVFNSLDIADARKNMWKLGKKIFNCWNSLIQVFSRLAFMLRLKCI